MIDPTDLNFPKTAGHYGSNPNRSGKYFVLTLPGAQAFASAPINPHTAITRTTLPQSILVQGEMFLDPGPRGAGRSVFFSQPLLPAVYSAMTPPEILTEGHEP